MYVLVIKICTTCDLLVRQRAFGLRPLCPPGCIIPMVGRFFSRYFTKRFAARDSRNLLAIFFPFFQKMYFIGIANTHCVEGLPSLWTLANRLFLFRRDPMDAYHRIVSFLCSVSSLFACSNAHLLPSVQFPLWWKDTQVHAANHKHSLKDSHPLSRRSMWLAFLTWKIFPVKVPLSKILLSGELDGRELFPFPSDSRLLSGSCFIPHIHPREN